MTAYGLLLAAHIAAGTAGLLLGSIVMWADTHRWGRTSDSRAPGVLTHSLQQL
ncbi:hypothetical protein [Nocardia mexicana]|uniref:Uncharacterized protein n=1 Tax=Nocardia mexicana TaxID=279262 RepID=A0A370GZH0_9NOCA|nr:hypothetical protein [Nocardia mexicana]RDI49041.1 hypothetical protein DFR68_107166 [Nocardia mexicana]